MWISGKTGFSPIIGNVVELAMILGIDPGLENTGWAVINEGKLVNCGVIKTKKTDELVERLEIIYNNIENVNIHSFINVCIQVYEYVVTVYVCIYW